LTSACISPEDDVDVASFFLKIFFDPVPGFSVVESFLGRTDLTRGFFLELLKVVALLEEYKLQHARLERVLRTPVEAPEAKAAALAENRPAAREGDISGGAFFGAQTAANAVRAAADTFPKLMCPDFFDLPDF
jgi:hypothetical protein